MNEVKFEVNAKEGKVKAILTGCKHDLENSEFVRNLDIPIGFDFTISDTIVGESVLSKDSEKGFDGQYGKALAKTRAERKYYAEMREVLEQFEAITQDFASQLSDASIQAGEKARLMGELLAVPLADELKLIYEKYPEKFNK